MKSYRILAYAAFGVIIGLIVENNVLACQAEKAKQKLDKQKKIDEKDKCA